MRRYSVFAIAREAMRYHTGWEKAWAAPEPKAKYDAVIVGAGGHGLATAYYLGKNHGIRNVAIIEKGWLGGGNTGRNTTVVRSNYFFPESVRLYDMALKLYEGLSRELNYNIMLSQRGMISLAHTPAEMEMAARVVNAMQINGTDAELFGPEDVRRVVPIYNFGPKRAIRPWAASGRAGRAPRGTMRWPGAMPARPLPSASTSSSNARCRSS